MSAREKDTYLCIFRPPPGWKRDGCINLHSLVQIKHTLSLTHASKKTLFAAVSIWHTVLNFSLTTCWVCEFLLLIIYVFHVSFSRIIIIIIIIPPQTPDCWSADPTLGLGAPVLGSSRVVPDQLGSLGLGSQRQFPPPVRASHKSLASQRLTRAGTASLSTLSSSSLLGKDTTHKVVHFWETFFLDNLYKHKCNLKISVVFFHINIIKYKDFWFSVRYVAHVGSS